MLASAVREIRLAVVDGDEHGDERRRSARTSRSLRRVSRELPSFDLVVATVGRTEELGRVPRLARGAALPGRCACSSSTRTATSVSRRSSPAASSTSSGSSRARGLSRARNVGARAGRRRHRRVPGRRLRVPAGLLDTVAERLGPTPDLDGLAGRAVDAGGQVVGIVEDRRRDCSTDDNLWNRANVATIFLRRSVVERVGAFDERLGLGSGEPWSSGEETDYLIRAVRRGRADRVRPVARRPPRRPPRRRGASGCRDGASVGYLLRKHRLSAARRSPACSCGRSADACARRDPARPRRARATTLATLRGRIRGYVGASRSNSSA